MSEQKLIRLTDGGRGDAYYDPIGDKVFNLSEHDVIGEYVAPSRLTRQIAYYDGENLRETTEFEPWSNEELMPYIRERSGTVNQWCVDWPHLPTEVVGDDPAVREAMHEKVMAELSMLPYEVKIVGLQRRYLFYFTDGEPKSQRIFLRTMPMPTTWPWTEKGNLRQMYAKPNPDWKFPSTKFDITPERFHELSKAEQNVVRARTTALLYEGPAWVLRLTLDGQQPAFQNCRVYVTDDAEFICSDWCQRAGRTVKEGTGGIDLQTQSYTLGAWYTVACVPRAKQQGCFHPKTVVSTTYSVKDLKKKGVRTVSTLAEARKQYQTVVARLYDEMEGDMDKIIDAATALFGARKWTELHHLPVLLVDPADKAHPLELHERYAEARLAMKQRVNGGPMMVCTNLKHGSKAAAVDCKYFVVNVEQLQKDVLQEQRYRKGMAASTATAAVAADLSVEVMAEAAAMAQARMEKYISTRNISAALDLDKVLQPELCNGTCEMCDLKVKDGVPVKKNRCYYPDEPGCLFRQHSMPAPRDPHRFKYPEAPLAALPAEMEGEECQDCGLCIKKAQGQYYADPSHVCTGGDEDCLFKVYGIPVPKHVREVCSDHDEKLMYGKVDEDEKPLLIDGSPVEFSSYSHEEVVN